MVLATAMAVSGTVILLVFRLQKSTSSSTPHCNCIISSDDGIGKKREKGNKKKKKKKRVHFAEDVVDPIGNSDEYRKLHSTIINRNNNNNRHLIFDSSKISNSSFESVKKKGTSTSTSGKVEMPENRVALYNGILRDRRRSTNINNGYSAVAAIHVHQYC